MKVRLKNKFFTDPSPPASTLMHSYKNKSTQELFIIIIAPKQEPDEKSEL